MGLTLESVTLQQQLVPLCEHFLHQAGFRDDNRLRDLVCSLAVRLPGYREEETKLRPVILVTGDREALEDALDDEQFVKLEEKTLDSQPDLEAAQALAERILKRSAALAKGEWSIYLDYKGPKNGKSVVEYGLFRFGYPPIPRRLDDCLFFPENPESVDKAVPRLPAISMMGVEDAGVELHRWGHALRFMFTYDMGHPPQEADDPIVEFSKKITLNVQDAGVRRPLARFIVRVLTDGLNEAHGSLVAVANAKKPRQSLKAPEWQPLKIDLRRCVAQYIASQREPRSLAALQATEALIRGALGSDLVTLFSSDGTLLGYRCFVAPKSDPRARRAKKPTAKREGGARRKAFAGLKTLVDAGELVACLIRSQDGEVEIYPPTRRGDGRSQQGAGESGTRRKRDTPRTGTPSTGGSRSNSAVKKKTTARKTKRTTRKGYKKEN